MSRPAAPTAWLDLPEGMCLSTLRAGLMAMRVPPGALPSSSAARLARLQALGSQANAAVFIDISRMGAAGSHSLLELDAMLPAGAGRTRIFLTRLAGGHVSEADRRWVRSLGFADLLSDLDPLDCEGQLRMALNSVASWLGLPTLAPADLVRYVRGMNVERDASAPRAVIRALTGLSAEAMARRLDESGLIADRTYHLQNYPHCFVGSEAVAWIARIWQRSPREALALGQALGALGLLVHVAQEHPFLDDRLYYRVACSASADQLDLGLLFAALRGPEGVAIADRAYMGKTYPQCWVGADGVSWLAQHRRLSRFDAWLVLHRLTQFGLIEHVTRARPFIDGAFYYRFTGLAAQDTP